MKLIKLFLLTCVLTACDGSNPGDVSQGGAPGSLAHSVVSGMATGVGFAAGHAVVSHAVNRWQSRRVFRRRR